MESLESFIFILLGVGALFCGITFVLYVLCAMIGVFYAIFCKLFSRPKCSNCAKAIGKRTISCLYCGSALGEKGPQEEMNPELYARVKAFVAEETRVSSKKLTKLTPDTDLSEGLGIAGDDGYDLLEAFCEEFEIQNTCEIDPYEYFGPEGCNPFYIYVLLYDLVFDREKLSDPGQTSLTMRDLVKSAEARRWIPPEAT
ncbi:hypothetical protein C6500_11230 [Candidatus Poribacteria bacterium]|nr:MAG: hypothetical protein C6500_11230 [Candidatus Poribacteria bacterium]